MTYFKNKRDKQLQTCLQIYKNKYLSIKIVFVYLINNMYLCYFFIKWQLFKKINKFPTTILVITNG